MGCRSSREAAGKVVQPKVAARGKPDSQAQATILPFVDGEEGCDSDRSSRGCGRGKGVKSTASTQTCDSSTQTQNFDEESCDPLRKTAMAWPDENINAAATNAQRDEGYAVDRTVEKANPSEIGHESLDPRDDTREMFATKYRLDFQTLPNSVDVDSTVDGDRTTVCSSASTEFDVWGKRDSPRSPLFKDGNVWMSSGLGSVDDANYFRHEASPVAAKKPFSTGPGLVRIGHRLVWID